MKCNKIGCPNDATKQIQLILRVHMNHKPAISTPFLFVCDSHANEVKFDELVAGDAWDRICAGIESMGYQKPDKNISSFTIQPIANEAFRFRNNSSLS